MPEELYNQIQALLEEGNIEEVVSILLEFCASTQNKYLDDISLLNIQLQKQNRNYRLGLSVNEQDRNRTYFSIIRYIDLISRDSELSNKDINKDKEAKNTKEETKKIDYRITNILLAILMIMVVFSQYFEEDTVKEESILTQAARYMNSKNESISKISQIPIPFNYEKLSDSKGLICDKLKCTPLESEVFIVALENVLNMFMVHFLYSTNSNNKDYKKNRHTLCKEYLSGGCIIQVIDNSMDIKTVHRFSFCDPTNIKYFQDIKPVSSKYDYEIESIDVFENKTRFPYEINSKSNNYEVGTKKEQYGIEAKVNKQVVRFVIRLDREFRKHKDLSTSETLYLNQSIVLEITRVPQKRNSIHDDPNYQTTYRFEGIIINSSCNS